MTLQFKFSDGSVKSGQSVHGKDFAIMADSSEQNYSLDIVENPVNQTDPPFDAPRLRAEIHRYLDYPAKFTTYEYLTEYNNFLDCEEINSLEQRFCVFWKEGDQVGCDEVLVKLFSSVDRLIDEELDRLRVKTRAWPAEHKAKLKQRIAEHEKTYFKKAAVFRAFLDIVREWA